MSVFQLLPAHVIESIVEYVANEAAGACAKQLLVTSHRWRQAALRHINEECTIDLRQHKQTNNKTAVAVSNKHESWILDTGYNGEFARSGMAEELTGNVAAHVKCLRVAVSVRRVFNGEAGGVFEEIVQSGRLVCTKLRRLVFAFERATWTHVNNEKAIESVRQFAYWIRRLAPRVQDVRFVEIGGLTGAHNKPLDDSLQTQQNGSLHGSLLMHLLANAAHVDVSRLGPGYFATTWAPGNLRLTSIRCRLDSPVAGGGPMAQVIRSSAKTLETLWVSSHTAQAPASILCSASSSCCSQPTQYPRLRVLTLKHAGLTTEYPELPGDFAPMPRLQRLALHGTCAFNEAVFRGNSGTLRSLAVDVDRNMAQVLLAVGALRNLQHVEMDCWADCTWPGQAEAFSRVAASIAPNARVLSLGVHLFDVGGVLAARLAASTCAQSLRVLRLRGIKLSAQDAATLSTACQRLTDRLLTA
ncbi:hypothetical protein GGI05_001907 [Coemansia sp. RSA 2603]|nr:hypothetical protein GGI05_001907 [Coemansia sp. RSA 2603]